MNMWCISVGVLVVLSVIKGEDKVLPPLPGDLETVEKYVTGVLFQVDASGVTEYDNKNKDNISVDIIGQGPVPWSVSRFNQGDLSPRLFPKSPYSQDNLKRFFGGKGYDATSKLDKSAQAWHPQKEFGIVLATIAKNGQLWQDGTPKFYGTVATSVQSNGLGVSMENKDYRRMEYGKSMDIVLGKAGTEGEANIDVAVAWFPYKAGWLGGYIGSANPDQPTAASWQSEKAKNPKLPSDARKILKWDFFGKALSSGKLKLPGVNSMSDGMLFCIATNGNKGNSDVDLCNVAVEEDGSERIQLHEETPSDTTKNPEHTTSVNASQSDFSFLYLPFNQLFILDGGHVNGMKGVFTRQDKSNRMTLKKENEGQYRVSIEGKGNKNGMLILQSVGFAGWPDAKSKGDTSHIYMSYEFEPKDKTFLIQSRYVKADSSGRDSGFPLIDTEFYVTWIDFQVPFLSSSQSNNALYNSRQQSSSHIGIGFGFGLVASAIIVFISLVYYKHKLKQKLFSNQKISYNGGENGISLSTRSKHYEDALPEAKSALSPLNANETSPSSGTV